MSIPRSWLAMEGTPGETMDVSQMRARSAESSLAFSFMKGISEGEPLSSSPSKKKVMRQGSAPVTSRQARQASTKVISCPLSSEAPRPRITWPWSVFSICGSKGSVCHRFSGSTGCTS